MTVKMAASPDSLICGGETRSTPGRLLEPALELDQARVGGVLVAAGVRQLPGQLSLQLLGVLLLELRHLLVRFELAPSAPPGSPPGPGPPPPACSSASFCCESDDGLERRRPRPRREADRLAAEGRRLGAQPAASRASASRLLGEALPLDHERLELRRRARPRAPGAARAAARDAPPPRGLGLRELRRRPATAPPDGAERGADRGLLGGEPGVLARQLLRLADQARRAAARSVRWRSSSSRDASSSVRSASRPAASPSRAACSASSSGLLGLERVRLRREARRLGLALLLFDFELALQLLRLLVLLQELLSSASPASRVRRRPAAGRCSRRRTPPPSGRTPCAPSVDFGVAPMSSCPRSSERNGTINGSRIAIAIATQRQGWVVTNRAHAPQRPPAAGEPGRHRESRHAQRVDAGTDRRQDRGQQRDRREDRGDDRDRRRIAERRHQGNLRRRAASPAPGPRCFPRRRSRSPTSPRPWRSASLVSSPSARSCR